MPTSAILELESKPADHPLVYTEAEAKHIGQSVTQTENTSTTTAVELETEQKRKAENDRKLKEVEKQQTDFGESPKFSYQTVVKPCFEPKSVFRS